MSQDLVYNFLKKNNKRWYSAEDISKVLGITKGSILANLKVLRKDESISFEGKIGDKGRQRFIYKYGKKENGRKA